MRPGPNGVGLFKSLDNYAKWWRDFYLHGDGACDDKTLDCYNTHNVTSDLFTNTTVANPYNRQWMWLTCNEAFEYWQVGAPESTVGYPPRFFNVEYYRRQCLIMFPEMNGHKVGMAKGIRATNVNHHTGGWFNTNTTRLIWVNGEYDPWRSLSVASDFRPGGPFVSTEDRPSFVIPKASHCQDLIMHNGVVNQGVKKVQDATIKKMKEWVRDFHRHKH
ncbi:hypothetical protein E4U43_000733 [Claviceps pusilla]|uniref:Uncharacterized protein n=1 Tax=Claviceps pusilla TaxID=123648 RepID=A0A9P7NA73_9HYPO|nr:hypothetical protein E4U43_000733 [Claviceps pusilla]